MRTFKAYFKKEVIESWRQYRYIVLATGFIIFAITDPIMLKFLPILLKSEIPPEMAGLLTIKFAPVQAFVNYIADIFQMVPLFLFLGLMGSIGDEIKNQRLVFPYSKGAGAPGIVLAKYVHYSLVTIVSALSGFLIAAYYSNLLFEGDKVNYLNAVNSAMLDALFFIFGIALLFFVSSLLKRGTPAAIITIVFFYFMPILTKIKALVIWVPSTLSTQAGLLDAADPAIITRNVLITAGYTLILLFLTIRRMEKVEVI